MHALTETHFMLPEGPTMSFDKLPCTLGTDGLMQYANK